MRYGFSARLQHDVNLRVQAALQSKGIVNVTAVAEDVRLRNLAENVALEDIEGLIVEAAQFCGAAMEFDSLAAFEMGSTFWPSVNGNILSKNGDFDALGERAVSPYLRLPNQPQ
jgi:hypothetical protein